MNNEIEEYLQAGANVKWGFNLSQEQITAFCTFASMLSDWNENRFNLTRLTSPRQIAVLHFLDSLAVLKMLDIPQGAICLDVGTGAGFPGIPLKIVRPDLDITLMDSTKKKLGFCDAVISELGLQGIHTWHARAEEAAREKDRTREFDFVLARALAPLERLIPWCEPFINITGTVVALKGEAVVQEIDNAKPVAARHHLYVGRPVSIELPEAEEQTVRYAVPIKRLTTRRR